MNTIAKINGEKDFNDFIKNNERVIMKFSASWCGPCRALENTLQNLDKEKLGNVLLAELDVDENENTCANFNIRTIPVLIYFKDGKEVARTVGNIPAEKIYENITSLN